MEIKILKESNDYLVISKPVGIAVHKGADRVSATLSDWLQQKYPKILKLSWKGTNRIGIVHRLDKNTTGVMIMAKNPQTLDFLQDQFRARKIEKRYQTLICGKPPFERGAIDAFIYTNPKNRRTQKVEMIDFGLYNFQRRFSATEYETVKLYNFGGQILTLLDINLKTGRKHQIRAHMKFENCPVVGDQDYYNKASKRLSAKLKLERQFLHAYYIKFKAPSGEIVEVEDELADDLKQTLARLVDIEQ